MTVQARLDGRSTARFRALMQRLGWTPSQLVREGIRLVELNHPAKSRTRIVGLGKFASGVKDLGSNKRHLKDFGR